MKINQENYEQYFLDYAEGTLSPEMERELMLFLESNPDLKTVLESFEASPLPQEEIRNDVLKNRLKKNIHPTSHIDDAQADEWLIRQTEGLLSEPEAAELKEFLELNQAYEYDLKLFRLAKAVPDMRITFPGKDQLKKKTPLITLRRVIWGMSAAAAVILLIISIRFFNQPSGVGTPSLENTPQKLVTTAAPEMESPDEPETAVSSIQTTPAPAAPAHRSKSATFRMEPAAALAVIPIEIQEQTAINLATYKFSPIYSEPAAKEKPLVAKLFGGLVAQARNVLHGAPNIEKIREADLNIWSLAEAGVKGFNTVTDRDLELMVRKDEEGKITSYALVEQDRLLLSKSLGKN